MSTPQERAAAAYRSGATTREIAAQLGVHESTVRRWLAAAGVPMRSRGSRPRLVAAAVARLRDRGASWEAVARRVKASKTGVRKAYARGQRPSL